MRTSSALAVARATESRRTDVRDTEQSFGSIIADVARLLHPKNTAANIAAKVGCSVRVVEMYLAGDREWSGDALAYIVAEIMRRHGARNLKVQSRE